MEMVWGFIGLVIGGCIGTMVTALAVIAKEGEEDSND